MKKQILGTVASLLFLMSFSFSAQAEVCDLKYTMKGWSAFYKHYKGSGVVTCPSGKSAKVKLDLKAGGFTFGASEIIEGKGKIRGITKVSDIYGGGFSLGGHAGFIKSVEGRWVPRGSRTVTLSGKGKGYDLGFSMGSLRISQP